jgi:uncharacterized protein YggU (UPF0235/DUF167 family)
VPDGIEVALKVTPRARRAAIAGQAEDGDGRMWLLAQVTAAPESGRANLAVVALLAEALGVAPSACELVAGAASRRKRVRVRGDPAVLGGVMADLSQGEAAPRGGTERGL